MSGSSSTLPITIKDNNFLDLPTDCNRLSIRASSPATTSLGTAYLPGAHADAIYVTDLNGPTTITDNFIDGTQNADAPGNPNSDFA